MPTLKQDRSLRDRHLKDMLYLGLPFQLLLLLAVLLGMWIRSPQWVVLCILAAMPLAIVGMYRQTRRYLHFPCPTCGAILHRSDKAEDGMPITFLCTACNTEWDTGFVTGSGD